MLSLKLIDAIYNKHKANNDFMLSLSLTPSSSATEILKRITKGMEPEVTLSNETVPHICLYIEPGRFGRNYLVYEGKFCMDFYGKTSYQAIEIFEKSFKILHDQSIDDKSFHSFKCYLAYDTGFATGIKGVKGYKAIYDVDFYRN